MTGHVGEGGLLAAAIALLISCTGTGVVRAVAQRRGHLDVPNPRSSHTSPTPRSGGLGVVAGVAAALMAARPGAGWAAPLPFLIGGCAIGLWDDVRALRPRVKMAALVAAAALAVLFGPVVASARDVPLVGDVTLGVLAPPLTVLWLVAYANAFNFMDGIDGIAGLTAAVSGAGFAVAGTRVGDGGLAVLGAATAGASAGFLPWNFPRARVFLGDAGSLPLGMLLAYLAVRAGESGALAFPASVLLLGPFLFDATFTLVRRALDRRPLGEAHREHLYQRLQRRWGGHPRVSVLYAGFACATAALALAYGGLGDAARLASLAVPFAGMLAFAFLVLRAERC